MPPPEPDALAGSTRFGALPSDDVLAGGTRGLTMMGRPVTGGVDALPTGALFDGRYSVVSLLGRGGMGAVYQAIDTRLKLTVAVKALHPALASRPELVETLSTEVALSKRLRHPNLLELAHFEVRADLAYVVMELMEGGDLDTHLRSKGGRLDQAEALRLVDGVLAGLEALHGERIAHLDVKPQNVLLTRDGVPKLADFGISSHLREQRDGGRGAGTPEYAAPEQMRGEPSDVRADLYAVGVMLHQLVTGDLPFGRDAARAWHESGKREFPRLPAALQPIVAKCTAVRPDDRFRSAAELRDALRSAGQGRVSPPTMTGWYPVPVATREKWASELSSQVWVDDHFETFDDPAKLLREGAARPSWRLKLGKVVLETHPLALISAGHAVPPGPAWLEAGRAALAGDMSGLVALGPQTPTVEARLALAALLGGDKQEALIRLGRASKNAKTTSELLAAAEATARGLGRSDEVEALVTRAVSAATTTEEHLAVAAFASVVRSDEAGAKTAWNAAKGKSLYGWSQLALLQGAHVFGWDPREVKKSFELLRSVGKSSPSLLEEAAGALGPSADVMEWVDEWSGEGASVVQLDVAAKAWSALGNEARSKVAKQWRESKLAALTGRIETAWHSVAVTGYEPRRPTSPIDEVTTEAFETSCSSEVALHRDALAASEDLEEWQLPSPAWTRPYDPKRIAAAKASIEEQRKLHGEAVELERALAGLIVAGLRWRRPYTPAELNDRRTLLKQRQQQAAERLKLAAEAQEWAKALVLAKALAAKLAPVIRAAPSVAEVSAVRRVLAMASGRLSPAEALAHARSGVTGDRMSLENEQVLVNVVDQTVFEETVTEQVPTGEVERYFEDELVRQSGWFGLRKAEIRQVERERPVMKTVSRVLKKPGPSRTKTELLTLAALTERVASGAKVALVMDISEVDATEAVRTPRGSTPVIVKVPAGSFEMGAGPDDFESSDRERPQRLVTLTRPFAIWSVPVTRAQYAMVMKIDSLSVTSLFLPAVHVSWYDAVTYCNTLSRSMGLPEAYVVYGAEVKWHGPSNPGWRLPTEAEWEYACRAGARSSRSGALDNMAWHSGNSGSRAHDVGGKSPNAWGLYDTLGNVWEWCWDRYGNYWVASATDPVGPTTGSERAYRGGSYLSDARDVRAASRSSNTPAGVGAALGFRPVRSLV